jgi:hypothetical protein
MILRNFGHMTQGFYFFVALRTFLLSLHHALLINYEVNYSRTNSDSSREDNVVFKGL